MTVQIIPHLKVPQHQSDMFIPLLLIMLGWTYVPDEGVPAGTIGTPLGLLLILTDKGP